MSRCVGAAESSLLFIKDLYVMVRGCREGGLEWEDLAVHQGPIRHGAWVQGMRREADRSLRQVTVCVIYIDTAECLRALICRE